MLLPNRQIGMTKFNFKHTPKQKNIKEEIFLLYCDTLLPEESLHHKEPSVCCEAKFCAGKPPRDTQAWRNQWDHPEDIGTWFICSQSKDLPWLYFCRQPLLMQRRAGSEHCHPQHHLSLQLPTLRKHHPDHRDLAKQNQEQNKDTAQAEVIGKTRFFLALGTGLRKIKQTHTGKVWVQSRSKLHFLDFIILSLWYSY